MALLMECRDKGGSIERVDEYRLSILE